MAIFEFDYLTDEELAQAIYHLDKLAEIFGESVISEEFELELRHELAERLGSDDETITESH